MASPPGNSPKELRIVLLGSSSCHKSAVGNIILGTNFFESNSHSAKCEMGEGVVSGRRLTLVNTPSWWREFRLCDTAELTKAGLLDSVPLCQPGPHIFLLVVNVDLPSTVACRRAVEEHLHLFGDRVWSHTIVLLNRAEGLGQTIEEFVEKEGEHLRWLINKCGNRYHVFNTENDVDGTQVAQLLEQIEQTVEGNEGSHFEYDASVLQKYEEMNRVVSEKAQERNSRATTQRANLRSLLKDGACQSPRKIEILLLGWVHSGKSSTANTILGTEEFEAAVKTLECSRQSGEVAGKQVAVVDTPGWWKYFPAQLTPDKARDEILRGVSLCSPAPHAVLLVIPVDTSFTADQKRVIQENMERFGEKVWRHTMVIFTWGYWLADLPVEQHIEREGEALRWLVEKCDNRYHVLENKKTGDNVQVTELLEKIEEMVAGNSLFLFTTEDQRDVEKAAEVTENKQEFDNINPEPLGAGGESYDLVVRLVNQEWDSTCHVMREKIIMLVEDKGMLNKSMDIPINWSTEEEKNFTEISERIQAEEKMPHSQREILQRESIRLKMILEREWTRRESEVIELYEYLRDHQGGSEAADVETQRSIRKVQSWLRGVAGSSRSSGYISELYSQTE